MSQINSRQTVLEYSDIRTLYKFNNDNAIEDFAALKADISEILRQININEFTPLEGSGNPEGVIISNSSKTYVDTDLSPVSVTMYYNNTINSNTGWVPVV